STRAARASATPILVRHDALLHLIMTFNSGKVAWHSAGSPQCPPGLSPLTPPPKTDAAPSKEMPFMQSLSARIAYLAIASAALTACSSDPDPSSGPMTDAQYKEQIVAGMQASLLTDINALVQASKDI